MTSTSITWGGDIPIDNLGFAKVSGVTLKVHPSTASTPPHASIFCPGRTSVTLDRPCSSVSLAFLMYLRRSSLRRSCLLRPNHAALAPLDLEPCSSFV